MDLALDNVQRLICHKIQPANQPINNNLKVVHKYTLFTEHSQQIQFISETIKSQKCYGK